MALVEWTPNGLYCPGGDFYIDPIKKVAKAVITHAHSDHARKGCQAYLTSNTGASLLRHRLGKKINVQTCAEGESLSIGQVRVSLHSAGHMLGSCQIRIENRGEVWVVSGDYKRQADPTCTPFEVIRCHTFITESTFALPIFHWPAVALVMEEIHRWWRCNQEHRIASVLFAYSLGKAQRLQALLDPTIGPIVVHPNIHAINAAYEKLQDHFAEVGLLNTENMPQQLERGLLIVPPGTAIPSALENRTICSYGIVSGWMRGLMRSHRQGRGFVLSDHADWHDIMQTIKETGAQSVGVMHGYVGPLVHYLNEQGLNAWAVQSFM